MQTQNISKGVKSTDNCNEKQKDNLKQENSFYPSFSHSFTTEYNQLIKTYYNNETNSKKFIDLKSFQKIINVELPVTFRINKKSSYQSLAHYTLQLFIEKKLLVKKSFMYENNQEIRELFSYYEIPIDLVNKKLLRKIPEYKKLNQCIVNLCEMGAIYRQEVVSMFPVELTNKLMTTITKKNVTLESKDPKDNKLNALDLCASPGSKSTQMLEYYDNVFCNEVDTKRLQMLSFNILRYLNNTPIINLNEKDYIKNNINLKTDEQLNRLELKINGKCKENLIENTKQNIIDIYNFEKREKIHSLKFDDPITSQTNIGIPILTQYDARLFPFMDKNNFVFDVIFCDVPCSSDGTIRKNQEKFEADIKPYAYTNLQYEILDRAIKIQYNQNYIKNKITHNKDIYIMYSTCSLSIYENEAVIDNILYKYNNDPQYNKFFKIELVDLHENFKNLQIVDTETSNYNSNCQYSIFKEGIIEYNQNVEIDKKSSNLCNAISKLNLSNFKVKYGINENLIPNKPHDIENKTKSIYNILELNIKNNELRKCVRIFPEESNNTGGFFLALLKITTLHNLNETTIKNVDSLSNEIKIKNDGYSLISNNLYITDKNKELHENTICTKSLNLIRSELINILPKKTISAGIKLVQLEDITYNNIKNRINIEDNSKINNSYVKLLNNLLLKYKSENQIQNNVFKSYRTKNPIVLQNNNNYTNSPIVSMDLIKKILENDILSSELYLDECYLKNIFNYKLKEILTYINNKSSNSINFDLFHKESDNFINFIQIIVNLIKLINTDNIEIISKDVDKYINLFLVSKFKKYNNFVDPIDFKVFLLEFIKNNVFIIGNYHLSYEVEYKINEKKIEKSIEYASVRIGKWIRPYINKKTKNFILNALNNVDK